MRRRDFITLIGAATAWPIYARAQQTDRVRRIGILMNLAEEDPEGQVRLNAFLQGLQKQGWIEGRNVRIDTCWGAGKAERYRTCAAELVGLAPDVILAGSGAAMPALVEATRSSIRWGLATLRAWPDRAATSPDLPSSNTALAQSGWNYSNRLPTFETGACPLRSFNPRRDGPVRGNSVRSLIARCGINTN